MFMTEDGDEKREKDDEEKEESGIPSSGVMLASGATCPRIAMTYCLANPGRRRWRRAWVTMRCFGPMKTNLPSLIPLVSDQDALEAESQRQLGRRGCS